MNGALMKAGCVLVVGLVVSSATGPQIRVRRGDGIRRDFRGRDFYSPAWYRRYPRAWYPRAWAYRHDELAMAFYGGSLFVCGFSLLAVWLYSIQNRRLIRPDVSAEALQSMTRRLLIAPGLCLVAIGCSLISIPLARLILVSIPVFYISHRIVALQKARASINERIHLRLWPTELSFRMQPVWIGQVSRDIGVRFTPKTWNLTTHRIDPDVDEACDYVIDNLISARRLAAYGYVSGVEAASEDTPRNNLTGDPYFTDGNRAVMILARASTDAEYLRWS
jgi:hypothetical protein